MVIDIVEKRCELCYTYWWKVHEVYKAYEIVYIRYCGIMGTVEIWGKSIPLVSDMKSSLDPHHTINEAVVIMI